jgi:hypothetical protein
MSKRRSTRSGLNTEILDAGEKKTGGRMPSRAVSAPEPKDPASSAGRQLSPVSLKVYLVASGKKWDQMAGFAAWATAQKLTPRTMPAWHKTYEEFLARPVK